MFPLEPLSKVLKVYCEETDVARYPAQRTAKVDPDILPAADLGTRMYDVELSGAEQPFHVVHSWFPYGPLVLDPSERFSRENVTESPAALGAMLNSCLN